ncbi:MAG TPA: response regulator [Paucimonas sp.]|nr:response regulator [Paucimonas sp.]
MATSEKTERKIPILLVDDRPANVIALELILNDPAYEIVKAYSGNEALRLVLKQDFALVLLDVQMPDMNGYETAELMRANPKTRHLPIIFVTAGMSEPLHVFKGYETGAVDYLVKPLEPQLLRSKVKVLCELFVQRQQLELHERDLEALVQVRTEALRESEGELKRYREHLEQLVEQRTKQLLEANAQLQESNRKLQEAHDHLLQSEKMASIGQLAAGVAHEINNPIGFVNSNLSSLDDYVRGLLRVIEAYESQEDLAAYSPEQLRRIEAVKEEAELDFIRNDVFKLLVESREGMQRVKRIVHDLKNFSQLGAPEWQLADLHSSLDSALNLVSNEIKSKAKVIKKYGALPPVVCLPLELSQVFAAMLVNAAQAIPAFGEIRIRTGMEGDQGWIEFSDTGCGIPPENLKRIFDPFFTTRPVGQGIGLGLSLAYSIVQKHGGRIDVDSLFGGGTTFRIWLPLRKGLQEAAAPSTAEANEPLSKLR